jgi:photosystem II stability/assembly factor-like uncharacterized protein
LRKGRALAVVALAVLFAGCSGAVSSQARSPAPPAPASAPPHISHPTTTTQTPDGATRLPPASTTPVVEDLTWVSDTHGWALVEGHGCGQTICDDVLTTTDGGTDWDRIGVVPAPPDGCAECASPGVSHIRFANDLDGYAFGPDLFVTTDGGAVWSGEPGPSVVDLEPAGADVMRVTSPSSGCPGPCAPSVQEAAAGSDVWRTLTPPFSGDVATVQLVRQGPDDAYVAVYPDDMSGVAQATVMISRDDGLTWDDRADPCGEVDGHPIEMHALAAAPGAVLAALCVGQAEGQPAFVAISVDGGRDFVPGTFIPGSGSDSFDTIAATSASGLVLGTGGLGGPGVEHYALLASRDGGRTWSQVANESGPAERNQPAPDNGFLGFESSTVGRWVGYPDDIWETTDGGRRWTRQSLPGNRPPAPRPLAATG